MSVGYRDGASPMTGELIESDILKKIINLKLFKFGVMALSQENSDKIYLHTAPQIHMRIS